MREVLHEDLIYEILAVVGEIPRGKVASYGSGCPPRSAATTMRGW